MTDERIAASDIASDLRDAAKWTRMAAAGETADPTIYLAALRLAARLEAHAASRESENDYQRGYQHGYNQAVVDVAQGKFPALRSASTTGEPTHG